MSIELQREWVEALRSGKYKQETGALHIAGGYCCLGVLCEVLTEKGKLSRSGNWYELDTQEEGTLTMESSLAYPLLKMIGIDAELESRLIAMNDDEERTFPEIAAFIEEKVIA